jgi:methyl-accepting chemotaxis protein
MLLWQKFAILGALALILVILPFSFYIAETETAINTAILETEGIAPAKSLLELIRVLQIHRGLSGRLLSGDKSVSKDNKTVVEQRSNAKNDVNQAITATETFINQITDDKVKEDWLRITQHWRTLQDKVDNATFTAPQSFQEHVTVIEDYLALNDKIADHFGLTSDADIKTYFMIQSSLYANPALAETLGKLRALGSALLVTKQATPVDLQRLSGLIELANSQRKTAQASLNKVFAADSDIEKELSVLSKDTDEKYTTAIGLLQKEILSTPVLTYAPDSYFQTYKEAIDSYYQRNNKGIEILDRLLTDKAGALRQRELFVGLGLLVLLLISSVFTFSIIRSITNPVSHLVDVMQKLAAGDESIRVRVDPRTSDELGLLGRQFDTMIDQRDLINLTIQKENEVLNGSIINLLQAVARLSQKDLTAKIPVSEDVTGLVADALNLFADETAKVLNRVVQLAGDVAQVSQTVKNQSDSVIVVATEEKYEVEQSNAELNNASQAMLGVAKLALSCNEAAEKAIKNTDKAQETVLDTVQGITIIRDTIRETEKRIKRLGERSQEIGGVVNLINNIAERTHILALNASMHAASAGEAGRGFAVVANEVQRLAENSREATSKIAALVNNIQVETADTVITMNEAIGQVVKGTDLAQQAGDEMRATRETTARLVQLVKRIAEDSNAQVLTTQRLQERALQIAKSTEETFDQLQEQGLQTEQLVGLSNDLVQSVSVFTLPQQITVA